MSVLITLLILWYKFITPKIKYLKITRNLTKISKCIFDEDMIWKVWDMWVGNNKMAKNTKVVLFLMTKYKTI